MIPVIAWFSAYLRDLCVERAVNAETAELRREPELTSSN